MPGAGGALETWEVTVTTTLLRSESLSTCEQKATLWNPVSVFTPFLSRPRSENDINHPSSEEQCQASSQNINTCCHLKTPSMFLFNSSHQSVCVSVHACVWFHLAFMCSYFVVCDCVCLCVCVRVCVCVCVCVCYVPLQCCHHSLFSFLSLCFWRIVCVFVSNLSSSSAEDDSAGVQYRPYHYQLTHTNTHTHTEMWVSCCQTPGPVAVVKMNFLYVWCYIYHKDLYSFCIQEVLFGSDLYVRWMNIYQIY